MKIPRIHFTELFKIALPIMLSNMANMFMHLVDMIFVGKLGAIELAACSIGNAAFSVLMVSGIGALSALDFLIPRDLGAGKFSECRKWFLEGVVVSVVLGLLCSVLALFSDSVIVHFGIAPEITGPAMKYLQVLSLSFIPFFILFPVRQYLQAFGVVVPATVIVILANVFNYFANVALVDGGFGFTKMGLVGSSWASVISRIFMVFLGFSYLYYFEWKKTGGKIPYKEYIVTLSGLREILRLGLPSGAQMLLEVGVFSTCTVLAGRLGATPLSAHQIVLQIASFTFMIPLGISIASSVVIGRRVGAGDYGTASRLGSMSFVSGICIMSVIGVILYVAPQIFIGIFTFDDGVIDVAKGLVFIAALFQIFDGVQVIGTGVLRGFGNTKFSMLANLVGHWFIGLPIGYFITFKMGIGVNGIWIGLCTGLVIVAVSLLIAFRILNNRNEVFSG